MDLSKIPPELLSHIPAGKPPLGTIPNFENPESLSKILIVLSSVFLSIMIPVVSIRFYSRIWIMRSFWWDDAACLLAVAGTIGYAAQAISCLRVVGKHIWDTPVSAYTTRILQLEIIGLEISYAPTVLFVKLSFFLFYLRIFSPSRATKCFIYFGIAAIVVVYTGTAIAFGVLCVPNSHQTWQEASFSSKCADSQVMSYIQGPFNVVSDFYIMLLPLPVVWKLQLSLKKKLGVSAIFMTGFLACISSIFALYYRVQTVQEVDVTWWLGLVLVAAIIELSVGIICSSMPHMVHFFRHHNLSFSYLASLKKLGSRFRRSRQIQSDESALVRSPTSNNFRLKMGVLGSMGGEGKFLKTGAFSLNGTSYHDHGSNGEQEVWTNREQFER